ncbi:unnamed protein product [Paramecium sonneborni]|uniref:Uncharacterized protein n=1 Tax=Paramecium sonneborni TaxID=65129 RepID=A0A8S1JXG2_9CILI|nr:unnamed protein product [Paramecium sonneborni]
MDFVKMQIVQISSTIQIAHKIHSIHIFIHLTTNVKDANIQIMFNYNYYC